MSTNSMLNNNIVLSIGLLCAHGNITVLFNRERIEEAEQNASSEFGWYSFKEESKCLLTQALPGERALDDHLLVPQFHLH